MGHARALLALPGATEQLKLREEILAHSWSVRTTEADVQRSRTKSARRPARRAPEITAVGDSLRSALATRVRLIGNESAGRIEVGLTPRGAGSTRRADRGVTRVIA